MPCRSVVFALLILLALAIPASTQGDTFVLTAFDNTAQAYRVVEVSPTGICTTLATLPPFTPYQVIPGLDNRSYRILGQTQTAGYPGAILNVDASGRVQTLVASTLLVAAALMINDPNGDQLIATRAPNLDTFLVRHSAGRLTTVARAVNVAIDGFSLDPETGLLLTRGFLNKPLQWGYYRVDSRTGAVTTFTLPPAWGIRNLGVGSRTIPYRVKTADFVDLSVHASQLIGAFVKLDGQRSVTTLNTFGNYSYPSDLIRAGGRAFPTAYHALVYQTVGVNHSSVVSLREDGTATRILPLPNLQTFQRTSFVRKGGHHLAWVRTTPPNQRIIRLSFPGEGLKPYVTVVSMNGVRPFFPLPDGRIVPVTFDALAGLCLAGGLPGVIENTVGVLDASGQATVKIDGNPYGAAIRGLRLWVATLVLDPAASAGVAHVVGPDRLEME